MIIKRKWPWIAQQEWNNILFIHWPVPLDEIAPLIPSSLELDTYDGQVWIGIVFFQATGSRVRGMPKSLSYPTFLQLNVRTYVKYGNERGVYFLSIDANRKLGVKAARALSLPFTQASMSYVEDQGQYSFKSRRRDVEIHVDYTPIGSHFPSKRDPLAFWLTERYCVWLENHNNTIIKMPILHKHWTLQKAKVDPQFKGIAPFTNNTYLQANPLVHYSVSMQAYLYPFEKY